MTPYPLIPPKVNPRVAHTENNVFAVFIQKTTVPDVTKFIKAMQNVSLSDFFQIQESKSARRHSVVKYC